jgi:release factor glutamine methyltransferase
MVTWSELVEEAEARFERLGVPEPALSARWIGRQATGTDAGEWLELLNTAAGEGATQRQVASFDRMVERRVTGEPLQYVIGSWGFRTLDLFVDGRVLIPRPETETVAERALAEIDRVMASVPGAPVVDLGTGSGAIGLSIAVERPGTEVWLTDASADALQVARANLAGTGRAGGSVRLARGDWFEALPSELAGRLGVVVSNPPYVASVDDLEPQVAGWEPMSALVAEADGTAHLTHLIDHAPGWLLDGGALVLEMAPDQVESMVDRARSRFVEVEHIVDLAGRARGLVARSPSR